MNVFHERDVMIEQESIPDLIKDLRDEFLIMVRQQIELAKTETSEKFSKLARNAAYFAAGSLILFSGVLFLLGALTMLGYIGLLLAGITPIISVWLAPLITAVVVGAIGTIMMRKALRAFKTTSLVPVKTVQTLKEDQQWLKQKVA